MPHSSINISILYIITMIRFLQHILTNPLHSYKLLSISLIPEVCSGHHVLTLPQIPQRTSVTNPSTTAITSTSSGLVASGSTACRYSINCLRRDPFRRTCPKTCPSGQRHAFISLTLHLPLGHHHKPLRHPIHLHQPQLRPFTLVTHLNRLRRIFRQLPHHCRPWPAPRPQPVNRRRQVNCKPHRQRRPIHPIPDPPKHSRYSLSFFSPPF